MNIVQFMCKKARVAVDKQSNLLLVSGVKTDHENVKNVFQKLAKGEIAVAIIDGKEHLVAPYPKLETDMQAIVPFLRIGAPKAVIMLDYQSNRFIVIGSKADHEKMKSMLEQIQQAKEVAKEVEAERFAKMVPKDFPLNEYRGTYKGFTRSDSPEVVTVSLSAWYVEKGMPEFDRLPGEGVKGNDGKTYKISDVLKIRLTKGEGTTRSPKADFEGKLRYVSPGEFVFSVEAYGGRSYYREEWKNMPVKAQREGNTIILEFPKQEHWGEGLRVTL
jgi:hypothetical protein